MIKSTFHQWFFFFIKRFLKNVYLIKNHIIQFFFNIFLGIILGNSFGTFLPFFRKIFSWDGFTIIILILISEFVNSILYNLSEKNFMKNFQFLNWIKIGLFLGFFIDAFKVGS